MNKKYAMLAAVLLAVTMMLVPTAAQAASASPSIPINISNANGVFNGVLNINRFEVQGNQVVAVGTLAGSVSDRAGRILGSVLQNVTLGLLPGSSATCPVLHLELGPLDANVLGLVIHLDKVVLDIRAQPGTLLGGLLCNLNLGGTLADLVASLNAILAAL